MSTPFDSRIRTTSSRSRSSSKPSPSFGSDGTADTISRPSSGFDINKPLPPNPEDIVRSLSSRTNTSSSTSSYQRSSTVSTSSPGPTLSRGSSRKRNRNHIEESRHLMDTRPQSLAPIEENIPHSQDTSDPTKSSVLLSSPTRYKNFSARNPWVDDLTLLSPSMPPPIPSENSSSVRGKPISHGLSQSFSEPTLQFATASPEKDSGRAPFRLQELPVKKRRQEHSPIIDTEDRGRKNDFNESPELPRYETMPPVTPSKRSRSPVKRLLGIVKSESMTEAVKGKTSTIPKTPTSNTKKSSVKRWGDKLRYGFLAPDQEQLRQEQLLEQHMENPDTPPSLKSTFPVSLDPPHQSKVHSEVELIITVTANRFLLREAKASRLSAESVARIKEQWHLMGRPEVIEFHYDQLTQHNLIVANLKTVKLHGDGAKDPLQINSTLHGWKILAKEMTIRTLCDPDSVIRKHLHDAHRVLELLGAPVVTFFAFEDMQVSTLSRISAKQKERMARKSGGYHGRSFSDGSRLPSGSSRRNASEGSLCREYTVEDFQMDKINLAPSPSPTPRIKPRKATGAEGAIMSLPLPPPRARTQRFDQNGFDPYDQSRGGRLGKMIREKPEDVLLSTREV